MTKRPALGDDVLGGIQSPEAIMRKHFYRKSEEGVQPEEPERRRDRGDAVEAQPALGGVATAAQGGGGGRGAEMRDGGVGHGRGSGRGQSYCSR